MEGDTLVQDDKKWDRVWTTDEIRKNSANWTLAGDVGLFNLLNEVSQNIISRTHEVQNAVDSLIHNTKMVSVKVNNIMNDFHMLSNLQFVENRVYDEEVQERVPDTKPPEKTKEQREAEMLPKIVKALQLGMSVLDKAFNKINVNEISDSEDEDLSSEGRTILEPKNPYEHRPLPFIIGSEEFMADEYAGLKDYIQEDVESSVESESSTTDSDETSSSEDELPLDDGKFSGVPTPRKVAESISDRFSSSEESELFGVEKEENGFVSDSSIDAKSRDNIEQKSAEESKPAVRDSRQSSVSSMQSKLKLPQVLPTPKHVQKKKESEDLFTNDEEFSDDDSPFRRKTGLFASEPRFNDDKDIFESDLFGSKGKEVAKPVESPKAAPPAVKKLPSAIPKNKEPDLFGDDEDSDDDIFNKLTRPKKPTLPKESFESKLESPDKADSSSTPSSAPSVKPSGNAFDFGIGSGNADALFGDDSDGDDLFSTKKTTTTTNKFGFNDEDDDDDLFGLGSKKKITKTKEPEKKKPVEQVEAPALPDTASKEKSYKKLGMPLPGLVVKKPKDSIFEDSDSSEQDDKKTGISPPAQPTKEKKEISLFDDDDDEEDDIFSQKPKLFSPGKSPSVKSKPEETLTVKTEKEVIKKETHPAKEAAPSLFDDFGEDDKAMFPAPAKKAVASLFEESDSFDLFKPKAVEKQKTETIKPSPTSESVPASSSKVAEKSKASLFEESDTFDLFKPKPIEKQKVEPPKPTPAPVSKRNEDSLFDNSDTIDGAASTKIVKQSSPVKVTKEIEDSVVGFDVPADSTKILNVLSKDRAKITSKRRKPTRKGRMAALENSEANNAPSDSVPSAPANNSLSSGDDLFSSEEPEAAPKPASTHKSQEKKKMDLMSQLMSEAASSKVLKKTPRKVEEDEDVVDIFAELEGKHDSKSQSFSFKSPIESNVKSHSDFLDDDKAGGGAEVSSVLVSDEAEDDFFSEPSFRKFSSSIPKKDPILDMDDDDDDDLFSIKPSSTLKPKTDASEVDIFADEADIFADLPKEKYEMFPSQLYDDEDEDDIFSIGPSSNKVDKSAKPATVPVKKETEKKSVEKKPAFEDPLTGLLGGD